MKKDENPKRFDLEDRTFAFAKRVREFVQEAQKLMNIFGAIVRKSQ